MIHIDIWQKLKKDLAIKNVTLIAVSKTKPVSDILELYNLGQRDFGENYVQELVDKQPLLPADVRWHYIGHLQTNKVKFIAPYVHLIHAVDSFKLLQEINKYALKNNRKIDTLLQFHLGEEATKYGMDEQEIEHFLKEYAIQNSKLQNVNICGIMGMATNTDKEEQIHEEFKKLYQLFEQIKNSDKVDTSYFKTCSMGMSGDYEIAIQEGSNMVRVGSLIFGERIYN